MSLNQSPTAGWEQVKNPPALFRRYEFASYRETRAFLDRLALLSSEMGCYPDLGFGTTYVNVTVRSDGPAIGGAEREFADRVGALETAGGAAR